MEESASHNPKTAARWNRILLALIFALALIVLAMKAYLGGWFAPHFTLELHQQPAVLFFNRQKGCDCAKRVYQAAEKQVQEWPEDARHGVQLVQINLDRWPDAGKQYDIFRAPGLLLVDAAGKTVYRQLDPVTDEEPLNLGELEQQIQVMISGQ